MPAGSNGGVWESQLLDGSGGLKGRTDMHRTWLTRFTSSSNPDSIIATPNATIHTALWSVMYIGSRELRHWCGPNGVSTQAKGTYYPQGAQPGNLLKESTTASRVAVLSANPRIGGWGFLQPWLTGNWTGGLHAVHHVAAYYHFAMNNNSNELHIDADSAQPGRTLGVWALPF